MEIIASMLSIVKNVNETDREYGILKQRLQFTVKKASTILEQKLNVHSFVIDNLKRCLSEAHIQLNILERLLPSCSSGSESISLKEKIKLSLPFNNLKEKATDAIEDLRNAVEEVLEGNFTKEEEGFKKKLFSEEENEFKEKNYLNNKFKHEQVEKLEKEVDRELEQAYELMGPTIQENNLIEAVREPVLEVTVEMKGNEKVIEKLDSQKLVNRIEKKCENGNKLVEIFTLGRLNFRTEYNELKKVYPDIDKISKREHFKIVWKPIVINNVTSSSGTEEFFSLPDNNENNRGNIIIEKEDRILYHWAAEKWRKMEGKATEVVNGGEFAVSLNPQTQEPELYFKINYLFKA